MSLIRIVDCTARPYDDQVTMLVDVLSPEAETYTYWITVPREKLYTQELLKKFIENDIKSQQNAPPNYKGLEWRSSSV